MNGEVIILTNVGDTQLITHFEIEFIVLSTATELEAHIGTLHAKPLILIEGAHLSTIAHFIITTDAIGEIWADERKESDVVRSLDAILDQKGNLKVIVTDKLAAKERAQKAALQKQQNQRILEIIADKQDAALKEKSLEELTAMLTSSDTEDEDE